MQLKNVHKDSFFGKYWRGICFAKFDGQWRINFKVLFDYKEEVKAFCKDRAGTWDSFNKCWFVPLSNDKLKDGTASEWLAAAISEFGDGMLIGDCLEWCFSGQEKYIPTWEKLFKQSKKQAFTVIEGGKRTGLEKVITNSNLNIKQIKSLKDAYDRNIDALTFARELHEYDGIEDTRFSNCLELAYYFDGKIQLDPLDAYSLAYHSGQVSLEHLIDLSELAN